MDSQSPEDQQKENTLNQELLNIFKDKGNMVNFSEINYKQKRQENIFDMKLKFNDIIIRIIRNQRN